MSAAARLDAWVGRHLFHPPIIVLCRTIGCNQYQLHRDATTLLGLMILLGLHGQPWGLVEWLFALLLWPATLLSALHAFSRRGAPMPPRPRFLRFMWLGMLVGSLAKVALQGEVQAMIASLVALVAEYALTLRSLPPRADRRSRQRRSRRVDNTA